MKIRRGWLVAMTVVAGTALVALTCTKNLLDPDGLEFAEAHGFLTDSAIVNPTWGDTALFTDSISVEPGDTVHFVGIATAHQDEITATWYFGDGYFSAAAVAVHAYDTGGLFQARFVITDGQGNRQVDTVTVLVNSAPAVDTLLSPVKGRRNIDPAVPILFQWVVTNRDRGDTVLSALYVSANRTTLNDPVASLIRGSSVAFNTALTGPKTYYWRIVVTDKYGLTDTSEIYSFTTIAPSDTTSSKPVLSTGKPTGTVATRFPEISASFAGTAPDLSTTAINLDGRNVTNRAAITITGFTLVPDAKLSDGAHTVRVSLSDSLGNGATPLEWSFTVDAFTLTATGDTTVARNDTVTLRAAAGNVFSSVARYVWDFNGDGSTDSTIQTTDTTTSIRHAYDQEGNYAVVVSVSDGSGTVRTDTIKVFVTSTEPVIQSVRSDTTISIKDVVAFTAVAVDLDGTITSYAWDFDGDGTFDHDSTSPDVSYRYNSVGTYNAVLRIRDNSTKAATDTVVIRVVLDPPSIVYFSDDTVVQHNGTVRCSVAVKQLYGTITVDLDTTGSGVFVPITVTGSHAVYTFRTRTATTWDSVRVHVSDDDGNGAVAAFKVDIVPRALTITRVDSTDTTITVRFSKTAETDFAEYRIYWDTTAAVSETGNLLARITNPAIVAFTDPPSATPRPRHFRIYQIDNEGLWSEGSNVVFGDIRNTRPTVPTILNPPADGDTIWANEVLRWRRSTSSAGLVRYRVLANANNGGYQVLADAVTDTFLQLSGQTQTTIRADIRVVAYDSRGNATAQRSNILVRATRSGQARLIPAGSFRNGAGNTIVIDHSFWMDTTEVTQRSYTRIVRRPNPSRFNGFYRPVEQVTWYDAVAYCNARSLAEGLDTVYSYTSLRNDGAVNLVCNWSRSGYRLPTEDEWEMAGRGGQGLVYPTDDGTISRQKANYSNLTTVDVATFPPNPYGLYNMAGNVSEWCWDNIYANRMSRGGYWASRSLSDLTVTSRRALDPSVRDSGVGFRCVRLAR